MQPTRKRITKSILTTQQITFDNVGKKFPNSAADESFPRFLHPNISLNEHIIMALRFTFFKSRVIDWFHMIFANLRNHKMP